MDARRQVIAAAEARAVALAIGDSDALMGLLHPAFRWTSHTGETYHRLDYIARNTRGTVRWRSQQLLEVDVTVVGDAAVLHAEVLDVVTSGGADATFRLPMTQVWVRQDNGWRCLAGHAGPARESPERP